MSDKTPTDPQPEHCQLMLRIVDRLVGADPARPEAPLPWLAETILATFEPCGLTGVLIELPSHRVEAGTYDDSHQVLTLSPRNGNGNTNLSLSGILNDSSRLEEIRSCLQTVADTIALTNCTTSPDDVTDRLERSQVRIAAYESLLQKLASELSLAEARERRLIAEDLHDHVGQALAFVRSRLARLQGNSVFHGFDEDFSESLRLINQTITYTRNLTVALSPPVLYELGLGPAVEWLAEQAGQKYGLKTKLTLKGDFSSLTEDLRVILFKTIQELLANVGKHAAANRVKLYVAYTDDGLEIRVTDDGCGFDTGILETRVARNEGFGLFSIRERIQYIGGTFWIDSAPGQGTTVTISAPRWTKD